MATRFQGLRSNQPLGPYVGPYVAAQEQPVVSKKSPTDQGEYDEDEDEM